jgi:hypothetical protein
MKEAQSKAIENMFKIFVLKNAVIMGSPRAIGCEENQNQQRA